MAVENQTMQQALNERRAALGMPIWNLEDADPDRSQPSITTDYFDNINSKQAYVFVAHVNLNKHMSADQLTIAGLDLRFEEVDAIRKSKTTGWAQEHDMVSGIKPSTDVRGYGVILSWQSPFPN
ncbi:hypothetical protein YC2023_076888 [Brassica napus]